MSPDPQKAATPGLRLQTDGQGDEKVIHCAGSLTLQYADSLKRHGKAVIPGSKRIVLDLKEVTRMDSSGLGALVGLYVSARKAKCEFVLTNYNKSVRDLLGISHLLAVFETCAQTGMRIP